MLILSLNTAASRTNIALVDAHKILGENYWPAENREAEMLLPQIQKLLSDSNKTFSDLEAVFAISGPGSFTGLRVGVTVANTVAYLNKIPVFTINLFEYFWLVAEKFYPELAVPKSAVLIFAGSGGVFVQIRGGSILQVKLTELNEYLHTNNVQATFGDISLSQISTIESIKFYDLPDQFAKMTAKIDFQNMPSQTMIEPYYLKEPSITQSKKILL